MKTTQPKEKFSSHGPRMTLKSNTYLTDDLLFLLWILTKINDDRRNFEFGFEYIKPPSWDSKKIMNHLFPLAKQFGIKLQNPRFERDYFKESFPEDYEAIVSLTKNQFDEIKAPEKTESAMQIFAEKFFDTIKRLTARKEIIDGKDELTMHDVEILLFDIIPSNIQNTFIDGIWFEVRVSDETRKKIFNFLDTYLKNFMEDDLTGKPQNLSTSLIKAQNFYTFKKHKFWGKSELENMEELYGNRFILLGPASTRPGFLYIHFLLALEKLGQIKINRLGICSSAYTHGDDPNWEAHITLQPSFDYIFKSKTNKPQISKNNKTEILLYLEPSGDLWRESKKKYCYPMIETRERLNIIKALAKHQAKTSNYFPTKELAIFLGKDSKYIRSEKGKINKIAKRKLKLELIDGKQGSGYRINPEVKIKILTR